MLFKKSTEKLISWVMLFIITTASFIMLCSLYVLSESASAVYNTSALIIYNLYKINLWLLFILSLCIIYLIINLYIKYKQGKFGAKLMIKLAIFFSVAGIIPGIMVYSISYKFVSSSLDAWFETKKIDNGIQAGIELGSKFIERLLDDVKNGNKLLATAYSENSIEQLKEQIEYLNKNTLGKSYSLISLQGNLIYGNLHDLNNYVMNATRKYNQYSAIETEDFSNEYRMRVLAPIGNIKNPKYFLQMVDKIPKEWADKINKIEIANQQHLSNKLGRNEFTEFYITTLTISLGFAICFAIVLSFWLGNQITRPLLLIEKNTKLVASGDLRTTPEIYTGDELGLIMRSFNHMITQISESRLTEQRSKNRLEGILTTMTAGVILLDDKQKLLRYNKSAEEILGINLFDFLQQTLKHNSLTKLLNTAFNHFQQQAKWQIEFEYTKKNGESCYLLIKGNILRQLDELNLLIVFDDLTEILSAQRTNAWGEVAKRLAHEIKNPLTPIQLSAERMQLKLIDKLQDKDRAMLEKSTNTIINQVSALKNLVDEFRHYSRLPHAIISSVNLNELVQDIVQLYKSSNNIHWRLELNDIPNILVDAGQIRQVLHNLIQNAQDAMLGQTKQVITIVTNLAQKRIHLCVTDCGPGFDTAIIDKVFEPYITTKKTGTGLGMAIVKKVINENNAEITISNRIDNQRHGCIMGAEVNIWFKSI